MYHRRLLNFTKPEYLIFDGNVVRNTYYNFGFNHETPDHADLYIKEQWPGGTNHYIDNNFANFIIRYDNRINNFRTYISDSTNLITFIIYLAGNKELEDYCKDLRDALAITYPKLIYRIIIIDGPFPQNVSKTHIIKIIDKSLL